MCAYGFCRLNTFSSVQTVSRRKCFKWEIACQTSKKKKKIRFNIAQNRIMKAMIYCYSQNNASIAEILVKRVHYPEQFFMHTLLILHTLYYDVDEKLMFACDIVRLFGYKAARYISWGFRKKLKWFGPKNLGLKSTC